ncbi:MAG TPA: methyl-accepting chemotaxis protein [Anaeromyxobacteraceae bacterium]|nr:methyl-accepting chemotaxis protein [Anaeromyxobacteraceae bacterium]
MEIHATGAVPASPPTPAPRAPAERERKLRFGVGLKVVGFAATSTAIVAVILALAFAREVEGVLRDELTSRGRLAVLTLANTTTNLLFSQDTAGLDALAKATLGDVPGTAYVIVRDAQGRILADAADAALADARPEGRASAEMQLGDRYVQQVVTVGGQEMLHLVALVQFQAKADEQYMDPLGLDPTGGAGAAGVTVLGTVELGFALSHLTDRIATASRSAAVLALLVFAACLVVMVPLARVITKPLGQLSRAALGIARGDLRQDVVRTGSDEVADVGRSFAVMISGLQAMQAELVAASAALATESNALVDGAKRQAASATEQSASLAQMNAAIQEIAQTARAAIGHADRVIEVTQAAEESSAAGERLVEDAVGSTQQVEQHVAAIAGRLGELADHVGAIGTIIETVRDLAQRSNVLALNAAIQAARSGESGAGFAVIAHEMRTLAEESGRTAGEVPKLLGDIVTATKAAAGATDQGTSKARSTAGLAQRAGATIGSLAGVCRESAAAARQIAESARQQATGVNEIVAALAQLARVAEANVEGGQEMNRAAERIEAVSGRLTRLAQRYRS